MEGFCECENKEFCGKFDIKCRIEASFISFTCPVFLVLGFYFYTTLVAMGVAQEASQW